MSIERLLSGDVVTVEPYLGDGAYGPVFGQPLTVGCRVEPDRKMARTAEGDEVVSEATLYVLPTVGGVDAEAVFTIESRVTHRGRAARVIASNPRRGLGPAVYVEVTLT